MPRGGRTTRARGKSVLEPVKVDEGTEKSGHMAFLRKVKSLDRDARKNHQLLQSHFVQSAPSSCSALASALISPPLVHFKSNEAHRLANHNLDE